MDRRDFHCPYVLSGEATAKGTGFAELAGEKDPVELKGREAGPGRGGRRAKDGKPARVGVVDG